ncbi:hypothetical protein M3O96_18000 [Aquiflexum sp. TKW24L]|uniref:hypothetical protein n=1 Tax=Aquiflexum sp. TKW24L TaxID=2942212 RepID=UPI0020BF6CE5|nr:hypothetical protein [Aquiflexum sp. TKW24L]MCL6261003.1 hypothetical protein [Aquiflexum sp. TKW24L]
MKLKSENTSTQITSSVKNICSTNTGIVKVPAPGMYFPSFWRSWIIPISLLYPGPDREFPDNQPKPEWKEEKEISFPERENEEISDPGKKEDDQEFPIKEDAEEINPNR